MTIITDLSLEWILSTIGFVVAFAIGLWQYMRAQQHEKVRLLLPLITEFETDAELQAACHLFDYDAGTLTLNGHTYAFTNDVLLEAMRVVEWDHEWPPVHEAIRDCLDRYFDFFGKLNSFVEINLITFKDLRYFYYYFELLAGIERYKGQGHGRSLQRYLESYCFRGCLKCLDMYQALPKLHREELQLGPCDVSVGKGE